MSPHSLEEAVRLYDPQSARLLAIAQEVDHSESSAGHCFACLDGNGALLTYYFGKGRREVLVSYGGNEGVHAHLATRWVRGRREWTLEW